MILNTIFTFETQATVFTFEICELF